MATIQELLDLAYQIRDAEQNGENTALRVGQLLVELVNHFNTKADVDNISGARHLKQQQAPIMALMSVQQMPDSNGQDNKAWWSVDGHIKYQHNGRIYDLGTPAYMLYYCGDKIYKWTGSATGFKLMTDGGGGSSGGGFSRVLEQRVAIIAEILQNAVFTSDQSQRFEDLAALEDAVDSITLNVSSHTFNGIGGTFILVATTVPSGKSVRWESSNPAVASVDSNGVVTPVSYGLCVITAKAGSNNVAATCSITVQQFQVDSVSIDQRDILLDNVTEGFTKQLTATTLYNGQVVQAGVTWSSSNPGVATIDANTGLVTVIGNGQTTITAISGTKSDTITIRVSGVVHTFHVSLGTLANVTIEDGQGNAITNGQAVMEGSSLAITFEPAASHVIDALSVVMGSTSLSLADATDGTDGAKVITIASVSGDIAISASAMYQAKDYAADPRVETITGYGVVSSTSGTYKADSSYTCKIIPLDFGKFYRMTDYNWQDGGTPTGYNIALVKSDGNGGYTNIINGTDVIRPYSVDQDYLTWLNNGRIYVQTTNSSNQPQLNLSEFYFGIPAASEFNDVEQVYLAVNTKFGTNNVSIDFHIREFRIDTYEDINWLAYRFTGQYTHLQFAGGQTPPSIMRFIPLEFGKTYNYSGYNWSELGGANGYYSMGLIAEINGIMHLPLASEVSSYDGTFFNNGINVIRNNAPENGTFSVPTQTNFPQETNAVYLAVIMQGLGQTMNMSNFTITENS